MAECPIRDEPKYILLAFYLGRRKLLNCLALSRITKDLLHTFEETPNNNSTKYVSYITACCLCKEKETIFKEFWLQYHNQKNAYADGRNAKTEKEVDDAWNDILQLWIEVETSNKDPPSHPNVLLSYERASTDVLKKHDVDVFFYLKQHYNEKEHLNNWLYIIDSVKKELEYCREKIEGKCGTVMSVPKCKGVRKAKTWGLASVFFTLFVDDKARTYAKCLQSCRLTGIQIKASRQPVAVVARYLICHKCLEKKNDENYISILEVLTSFYADLGNKRMPKQLEKEKDIRQNSMNDAKDDGLQVRKSSRAQSFYKKYSTLIYDVGDSDSSGEESSVLEKNSSRIKRKLSDDLWKEESKKPRLSRSQESSMADIEASSSKKKTSPYKPKTSDMKTSVVIVTSEPFPSKTSRISPIKSLGKVNTGQRLISKVSLPQILPKSSSSDLPKSVSTVTAPKLPIRPIASFAKLISLPVSSTQQSNGIVMNKPNQLLLLTSANMQSDTTTKLTSAKLSQSSAPVIKTHPSSAVKNRSLSLDSSSKHVPISNTASTSAKRRSDSVSCPMFNQSPKFVIQVVGSDIDNAPAAKPVAKRATEIKSSPIFFLSPVSGDNMLRSVVNKASTGSGHRILTPVPLKTFQNGLALENVSANVKNSQSTSLLPSRSLAKPTPKASVVFSGNAALGTKANPLVLTKVPISSLSQLPFVKLNGGSVLNMPAIHPQSAHTSRSATSHLKKPSKLNEVNKSPGSAKTPVAKTSTSPRPKFLAASIKPSTTVVVVPSTVSETSPTLSKKSSSDSMQSPFKSQGKKKQVKPLVKCLPTVLAEYLTSIMPSNKTDKRKKKRNDKSSLLMPMPYESHFLCITDTIEQQGWKAYWYRKCRCSRYRERTVEAQEMDQETALATEELAKWIPKQLSARSKMFLSKLEDREKGTENFEGDSFTINSEDRSNTAKSSNSIQTSETEAGDSNFANENIKSPSPGSIPSTSSRTPQSRKFSPSSSKIVSDSQSVISTQIKKTGYNSPPSSGKSLKARYCRDKNGNWMAVNGENGVNDLETSRGSVPRVAINLGRYFTDADDMNKDIKLEHISNNENKRVSVARQKAHIIRALLSQPEVEKDGLSVEDDASKLVCFVQFKDKSLSDPMFDVVAPTSKCFADYPTLSANITVRDAERTMAFQSLVEKPEDQQDSNDLRMRKEKDFLMSYIKSDTSQYRVPRGRRNCVNPTTAKTVMSSRVSSEGSDQNKVEQAPCSLVSTLETMWKQGNEKPNISDMVTQKLFEGTVRSFNKEPPSNMIKLKVLSWRARRRQIVKQIELQAVYREPELENGIGRVLTAQNAKYAVSVVITAKMLEENQFKLQGIKRRRRRKWSNIKTSPGNKTKIGTTSQKSSLIEDGTSSSNYWSRRKRKRFSSNRTTSSRSLRRSFSTSKKEKDGSNISLEEDVDFTCSSKGKKKVAAAVNPEESEDVSQMCNENNSEEKYGSTVMKTSLTSSIISTESVSDVIPQNNSNIIAASNKRLKDVGNTDLPTVLDDGVLPGSGFVDIKKLLMDVKYEIEDIPFVMQNFTEESLSSEPTTVYENSEQTNVYTAQIMQQNEPNSTTEPVNETGDIVDAVTASDDSEQIKALALHKMQQTESNGTSTESIDKNVDTEHAESKRTLENQELASSHVIKEENIPEDLHEMINRSTESLDFIKDASMDFDLSALNSEESRSNSPEKMANSYCSSKSGDADHETTATVAKVKCTEDDIGSITQFAKPVYPENNHMVQYDRNDLEEQVEPEKDYAMNVQEDKCTKQEESRTEDKFPSEISWSQTDTAECYFPNDCDNGNLQADGCLTKMYEYGNYPSKMKSKSNYISRKNAIEMLCSEDDDNWSENWQALSFRSEIQDNCTRTSCSKRNIKSFYEVYNDLNKIISPRKTKTWDGKSDRSAVQSLLKQKHATNLHRVVMSVNRISPFLGRMCTLPRLQNVFLLSKGKTHAKKYSWTKTKSKKHRIAIQDSWINGHLRCYMKQHNKKANTLQMAVQQSLRCTSPMVLPCQRLKKYASHSKGNIQLGLSSSVNGTQAKQSGSDIKSNKCDIFSKHPSDSRSELPGFVTDDFSNNCALPNATGVTNKEKPHRMKKDIPKHTLDGSYWSCRVDVNESSNSTSMLRRSRRSKSDDRTQSWRLKGNKRKRAGIGCLLQESDSLEKAESSLLKSYKNHALQSAMSSCQTKDSCSDGVLHSLFTSRMDFERIRSWMWDSNAPKPLRLLASGKSAFSEIVRTKLRAPAVRSSSLSDYKVSDKTKSDSQGDKSKLHQGSGKRKPEGEREYFSDSESQSRTHSQMKRKPGEAVVSLVRCSYPISPRRNSPPEKKVTPPKSSSRLRTSISGICAKKTATARVKTEGMLLRRRDVTVDIEVDTLSDNDEEACSSRKASFFGKNKFLKSSSLRNNFPVRNERGSKFDDVSRTGRRQSPRNIRSSENRRGMKRPAVRNDGGTGEQKQRSRSEEKLMTRSVESVDTDDKIQALRESVYAEMRTISRRSPHQKARKIGRNIPLRRGSPLNVPGTPKEKSAGDSQRALLRYSTEGSFISRLLECESPDGGNSDEERK